MHDNSIPSQSLLLMELKLESAKDCHSLLPSLSPPAVTREAPVAMGVASSSLSEVHPELEPLGLGGASTGVDM